MSEKPHEKPHLNDYSLALDDVVAELWAGSERACAVLAGAYLEALIGWMLGSLFPDDDDVRAELDDGGSFNRRIELLRPRGLVEDRVIAELHLVRRVRNRFAHWWEQVSFEDPPVRQWCGSLHLWQDADPPPEDARGRFQWSVYALCYRLLFAFLGERKRRSGPPP